MYRPPWYSPFEASMDNPNAPCPETIRKKLRVLSVPYISFHGLTCSGNLVVHQRILRDISDIFEELYDLRFPIAKIVPVSSPQYEWSDDRSMNDNNTSCFNYRMIAGKNKLSLHAYGCALDINPRQNPFVDSDGVKPPGAEYDISAPGTIVDGSPVVRLFLSRGFTWGGHWITCKDYHHFEKSLQHENH